MGRGHLGIRKILEKETMYHEKKKIKHKCDFSIHCILRVELINNKIQYYNVMKCNKCLSFRSIREPGNIQGCIFKDLSEKEKVLPLITAYYNHKNIIINFADLENVTYNHKI